MESRSVLMVSWSETVLASILPGHHAMNGTRWPPSQMPNLEPRRLPLILWPRAAAARPPWLNMPPLSLVKMMRVLSATPLSSRVFMISPTIQSSS